MIQETARRFGEQGGDLAARQDDGQAHRPLGPHDAFEPARLATQHLLVQKQQRSEGLVLRGRADVSLDGERGEELRDLGPPVLSRMVLAVEEDVTAPADIRFLSTVAVVAGAEGVAPLVEQPRLRGRRIDLRRFADEPRCVTPACVFVYLRSDHASCEAAPGRR
jgi:hypothetical protein